MKTLGISILVILTIATLCATSAQAAQVSVEPAYISVSRGEMFTVNITVDPEGAVVMGAQYNLSFNNTLLNATEQEKGYFLSHDGANTLVMPNRFNNTIGVVEYGEARISAPSGVTTYGVLASITFRALEPGVCSLNLSNVILSDLKAVEIPGVQVNNGTVGTKSSTPFMIHGYVFYENNSECNNATVNITNLDTGGGWVAETIESSNYYQIMLASCADVIAGETLQFNATSPDGSQSVVEDHVVTQEEIDNGGLFNYNITLVLLNDAPVANNDTGATPEDTAVTTAVLDNDSDPDGDTLSVTAVTDPANGVAVINGDNTVTYTPDADFNGADSYVYTISDGNGGTDTATVTITVNPVNDAPVANNDTGATPEDTAVTTAVLDNDSDPDGDTLSVTAVTDPANGVAVINGDNTVTYTPDADFNGADSYVYTISDGNGGTDTATVTVTVNPVNDAPVANSDTGATPEDTAVTTAVLDNDSDPDGDTLSVTAVTDPANGVAVINGDNTVTYTPDADFNGADSYVYTISDGNGGTDTATVTITVNPVNDAPVANSDTGATPEDTAVTTAVLDNDSDPDGDTLSVTAVTDPANGVAVINGDNTVTYTPDADFNGADSYVYTISDGNGGTDTATVTITVNPVNDAPVANSDTGATPEDTAVTTAVLDNDSDPDGDTLSVTAVTDPANGVAVINGTNTTVTYTPDANFNGVDSYTYTISDGNGGTDTATVTITVSAVNDAPVADPNGPYTGTEGIPVTFDGSGSSDPDGSIDSYDWDFGDGNSGSGVNPTHAYAQDGTYTVTLTVTDNGGATDSNSTTVVVGNIAPTVTILSPPAITNDSTPLLYATFDQIAASTWYVIDGAAGTGGSNTDNLTVTLPELADGQHTVTVYANNSDGNVGSATQNFLVDSIAPAVTIYPVTSPTNVSSQTITGTFTESGSGIALITVNGVEATISDSTYSAIISLTEESNQVDVIAVDIAGNSDSNTTSVVLDTIAPEITIDTVTSPTNVSSQTITGTVEESGTSIDSITVNGVEATISGLTYSVTISLTEGTNQVDVIAVDITGNSGSNSTSIVLDTTAPAITIDTVTSQTNINSQTITGTFDESGTGIALITVNGVEATISGSTYSATISLTEGTNSVDVIAIDNVGNSGSNTTSIVLDTIEPEIIIDPVFSPTNVSSQDITGTFDESGSGIASITVNGVEATISDSTYSAIISLTEGPNPVDVIAIDNAGNSGSNSTSIVLDTKVPELTLELVTEGNISTLYINSSEPLSNCTVDNVMCTKSSFKNWSEILEYSREYLIVGTDLAGNEALRNLTLEIGIISETDNYNRTNYSTGNVTINITTSQHVNESNITICEYDENPVGSLETTTVSLLGINKFVQIEVDSELNDSIGTVRISINYSGADLSEIDEDSLKLHVWNASIEKWKEVPGGVDKVNKIVWGELKHLSLFGILGEEPDEYVPPGNDGNGGSGGGGGASGEPYENIACSETDRQYVNQNSDISYSFELECNIVQYVNFTGLTNAGKIATKTEILKNTSTLVDNPPSDIVYKNLNIWVGNAGWATERNIADATVVFTVEKSWITKNNIDESSIALYRYSDNTWHELVTRKIAEDADSLQFEAETPGFSLLAVTGKKTMVNPGGAGIIVEPTVTAEKTPVSTPTDKTGIPGFSLFVSLSVLLIAVQLLRKKK